MTTYLIHCYNSVPSRQAVATINDQIVTSCKRRGVTSQVQVSSLEFSSFALASTQRVSQPYISFDTILYLPSNCSILENALHFFTDKVRDLSLDVPGGHGVDTSEACPLHGQRFAYRMIVSV